MLPDPSIVARSSVCRLKRGGRISPLLIQKGDIGLTFCSLVDNINLFFPDVFLISVLFWL